MEMSRISFLSFPKISDERGNLTYIQYFDHIPFEIKRVYWLYDVPSGQTRGGHAFKSQNEIVIALSGSFQVYLTDGVSEETYILNRPNQGLYIPKMTWRQFRNFSTNTVVLIITSDLFNEEDYINDFSIFKTYN